MSHDATRSVLPADAPCIAGGEAVTTEEVTFTYLLGSLTNLYSTIQAVVSVGPCADSGACTMFGDVVRDAIGSALGSAYEQAGAGGLPCVKAIVALDALPQTFRMAPPVDEASGATVLDRASDVLAVIAPQAPALTVPPAFAGRTAQIGGSD